MELFSVFENLENLPIYDQKPKLHFFEFRGFGHNSATSLQKCCNEEVKIKIKTSPPTNLVIDRYFINRRGSRDC